MLATSGRDIQVGGEVLNREPNGHHTSTYMGSGIWPSYGYGLAAFQTLIRYVDLSGNYAEVSLSRQVEYPNCYDASPFYYDNYWHTYFYFGGPGYASGNCT